MVLISPEGKEPDCKQVNVCMHESSKEDSASQTPFQFSLEVVKLGI